MQIELDPTKAFALTINVTPSSKALPDGLHAAVKVEIIPGFGPMTTWPLINHLSVDIFGNEDDALAAAKVMAQEEAEHLKQVLEIELGQLRLVY